MKAKFWLCGRLILTERNFREAINSRIIQLMPEIRVSQLLRNDVEELLVEVAGGRLPQLKTIVGDNSTDFSSIDPELFSQAVVQLEQCNLEHCNLSNSQLEAIMNKIIETEDLRLKCLEVDWRNLLDTDIPADTRARAAVKLEHTNIHHWLHGSEVINLFQVMADSPIFKMKHVNTAYHFGDSVSDISPDVLSDALVRVEKVLDFKKMSRQQSRCLLYKIVNSENINIKERF